MLGTKDPKELDAYEAHNMLINDFKMPFSETTFLYSMWLVWNIPCVAFGSYRGYRAEKISIPVRTSRIERDIPTIEKIPFHAQPLFTLLVGSLLTSLCVVSEMFYLVTSIWRHTYYFMFGYLGIALFIMGFVAMQVSKVQTYWTLNAGNYNW